MNWNVYLFASLNFYGSLKSLNFIVPFENSRCVFQMNNVKCCGFAAHAKMALRECSSNCLCIHSKIVKMLALKRKSLCNYRRCHNRRQPLSTSTVVQWHKRRHSRHKPYLPSLILTQAGASGNCFHIHFYVKALG